MDGQLFRDTLLQQNMTLNDTQMEQFARYYDMLVEWNEKINLTAITNKNEVYLKHFYDSITPSFYFNFTNINTVCDVGAGAGFPSLPLKICYPHLHVTIIDSLKKRINFLAQLVEELNLTNVQLVHARAEDAGKNKQYRESFDLVTARAVANMAVLSEYCLPFSRIEGTFIALKGASADSELALANNAISLLGGQFMRTETFNLPQEESERSLIFVKKVRKTPKKFPRKAGTPNKEPLT